MDPSDVDTVFELLDETSRIAAFRRSWDKLESVDSIDLGALRLCIRLLPSGEQHESSLHDLKEYVVDCIWQLAGDHDRLSHLASICLENREVATKIHADTCSFLQNVQSALKSKAEEVSYRDQRIALAKALSQAVALLHFLRCSYWRCSGDNPSVSHAAVQTLCDSLGYDRVDGPAHDALSALLALVQSHPSYAQQEDSKSSLSDNDLGDQDTHEPLIAQQLWSRFQELPDEYFTIGSSLPYKTWFQWISLAASAGIDIEGVYEPSYWKRLRFGLMIGFTEQRKYCLGILRQSISIARRDIDIPAMSMSTAHRLEHQKYYEKFSSLFETIILDRYPNQVQACLPELTNILRSQLISSTWITALLSAALNPTIQDGVRKLVGAWYMTFVTEAQGAVEQHLTFLVEGFLPWAVQGSLFTASLTSTRCQTTCRHGILLSDVICRFVTLPLNPSEREKLLVDILDFIVTNGDKMFKYAIVYILHGLIQSLAYPLSSVDAGIGVLDLVTKVSRLTGFPEVASDLCIVYCATLCQQICGQGFNLQEIPGYDSLKARYGELKGQNTSQGTGPRIVSQSTSDKPESISQILKLLKDSRHKHIQDDSFVPACTTITAILENTSIDTIEPMELCEVLQAIWEEADRQEFRRPVAMQLSSLFFHKTCIEICVNHHKNVAKSDALAELLSKVMQQLRQISESRSYLLSTLYESVRQACIAFPGIIGILPIEETILSFVQKPPEPKTEFLFEIALAEQLQTQIPQRDYAFYYGRREWYAYACVIDLLNRWPAEKSQIATDIFNQILEPWTTQKRPIPIISKWKETFQLQAMLLLGEFCISDTNVSLYVETFMAALILEPWPRYRYLLEWIVCRIYHRFPHLATRILPDLSRLDEATPIQVASLMKLAVLAAPFLDSEDFALKLMTQLIPFSASMKVHIRHEAHWSFPIIFQLAHRKGWASITSNPAFKALYEHICSSDKYGKPAWTIRTLKLDAINDFTLVNIFQGDYLSIESHEQQFVAYEDFEDLWAEDQSKDLNALDARVPLGMSKAAKSTPTAHDLPTNPKVIDVTEAQPAPLQTKSGFDLASLLPQLGPPSSAQRRPASVILIASLIDNPTNLGGLSRIAESFGLQALYINSLKAVETKEFKNTAVTSYKHLDIKELKVDAVSGFLVELKGTGWQVVGVEQTDRSGILGQVGEGEDSEDPAGNNECIGTLPRKCVLVLGSEKGGITSEVLAVVDRCVEIRTVGVTRSLNVQTAGGIAVYEWWREWGGKL
ncbi:hypothetical protein K491DRAFT_590557 [Lophiostoma macrostomum CBS 122681]|uniref:tRNA/rRNA methyltransferase SpoU type domain-containing protein n=1 Tax=Lophiostoma macrostomum CBS 122681 TaxID=1314788 RepID=A0A6A6TLC6_9PLEO|nr:hypothetical protein K491DRAFT_590557 [Lophiostoma macrostomum CBS 122681]